MITNPETYFINPQIPQRLASYPDVVNMELSKARKQGGKEKISYPRL